MKFKEIVVWLVIFIIGSLVVSFLIYPKSFQSFKENVASKISNPATLSQASTFRCGEKLQEWLKTEKIKQASSISVKVIEEKSFTTKTELLSYLDKWNVFNEYEIKKKIEEITKVEEKSANVTTNIKQQGKSIILEYEYSPYDVEYVRLEVTKWFYDKNSEIVCDKTSTSPKGVLECDTSEFGEGNYNSKSYIKEVDKEPKIWTGQIDTVLVKEEGKINDNDVAILVIGICDDNSNLNFG